MDRPPADHGSNRYDYAEVIAPPGVDPSGEWLDSLLDGACGDCLANVFLRHLGGDPGMRASWDLTIAHDDTCPWMTALEKSMDGE